MIAKIYFTKIPSSARALDSLPPPRKMPSINFYPPTKQQFSCYNPIKTSFLAVVVAPVPFPFEWFIVINEIRQISRKKFDFAKLTETRSEIS